MVCLKIFNDDKIRRFYKFPLMKDPNVLENTLLRIINEYLINLGLPAEPLFDINNPRLANLFFTYYTSSNFYSWGELPLAYIYNDMVRHIKNQNTSNNFILTLESVTIDINSIFRDYCANCEYFEDNNNYIPYEIISAYVAENYLASYNYMINNTNGTLVVYIPRFNGEVTAYIVSVGFNPYNMAKWFCTSKNFHNPNTLSYTRERSLKTIINSKNSGYMVLDHFKGYNVLSVERSDTKIRESIEGCINFVKELELSEISRTAIYDTSIKYGNYVIDENILSIYDNVKPLTYLTYTDKNHKSYDFYRFNQLPDNRIDYGMFKRQNDMIKIEKRKKGEY